MIIVLLLVGVILLRFHPAFTNLTVIPKDTVVLTGDSTALGCNSSGASFTWSHKELEGKGPPVYFYINKQIISAYERRGFRMVTNQELRERNLAIENVTRALAGTYKCDDAGDEDPQDPRSAQLIVLEKLPECSATVGEFIGPNDCNNFSYEILLSCNVRYHGTRNKSPDLVWRKSGESTDLNSTCTTLNDSEKVCNVTVQADLHTNVSSFVCQTTERAAQEQYKCTTQPITTLHSFSGKESEQTTASKGEEVVCNPISSFSCTYKWVWYEEVDGDMSRTIESTSNVLIAKKLGLHRCEAHCKLRDQKCTIFTQYVNVIESQRNLNNIEDPLALIHQLLEKETQQSLWTPPVICLLILGVLPYATFVCFLFTRMRRKRTLARDRIPATELL